ncbi:LuxR C-terminal-related transcriptional regulator [Kitasatospora sp. NBC_00374]|uniref:LuxR C-terminal-related transcriptional regulator n=1 Tax=Kitasatospora sp. NBC_00374 TaxID=2975964 RepID=UPI0030DFD430
MGRIRVLVVDSHRIFAEALAAALAGEPDVDVGAAGTAAAAERALERAVTEHRAYDVVLIDADLGPAPQSAAPSPAHRQSPSEQEQSESRRGPYTVPVPRRPSLLPAARSQPAGPQQPAGHQGPAAVRPVPQFQREPTPAAPARGTGDGIALLARVCRSHPELRAVVLAAQDDPRRAVRALHAGASGWVAKESSLGTLMTVVRGVLRDETFLPPALLTGVVRELTSARRDRSESERLVAALTPREEEVLRCMVAGLGRQAVAERLYLSPHTVRTHMQNVLGKLGVHSTLAAVAVARRAGISPAEPPPPSLPAHTVASTTGPGAG